MGKQKVTRIVSLVMALLFLVSGAVVSVSAGNGSVTDKSIADYIDMLGIKSYDEYVERNFEGATVPSSTVSFDATKNWVFKSTGGAVVTLNGGVWTLTMPDGTTYTEEQVKAENSGFKYDDFVHLQTEDGVTGLYTPGLGSTTWTLDLAAMGLTENAIYNITLGYFPVINKTASVEREFYINGEVPFSEARTLTLPKRWSSYMGDGSSALTASFAPDKKLQKSAGSIEAAVEQLWKEATDAGLVAYKSEDGKALLVEQPAVTTAKKTAFLEKYGIRFFVTDMLENELRPTMKQDPEWMSYTMQDSSGYYTDALGFVIRADKNGQATLTLKGVNEPVVLSSITFSPYTTAQSYEAYLQGLTGQGIDVNRAGTDSVKIEGEYTVHTSTNVVYPVEDRTDALTSPADTGRTMLNTIGTEKWETAGQWVRYQFTVTDSGMYDIFSRFKQSYLDGMYVCRMLKIYTEEYKTSEEYKATKGNTAGYYNGTPFAEASKLRFDYDDAWQVKGLSTGSNEDATLPLYFEAGVVYTLHLEVTLGSMSGLIRDIENILNDLNDDYLSIIKLTGSSPDDYRDYNFYRLLPNTMTNMLIQAEALDRVSKTLKEDTVGVASSYTGICDKLSTLLKRMGGDEDEIAKNLTNFKSYIGSLGTFLTDAKTQPLQIDYLSIQGKGTEAPRAKAGFFKALGHEISNFFMSFIRDYNNMGSMETEAGVDQSRSVNVWLAYGRDQSQVIRNLCTNDFTKNSGIAVDLKLVSGGTLLPSILAGMGPDAYLGLGQTDVINYAIRGALINVENMSDFDTITVNFNEAAMMVLGIADSDGDMHYYGLPENQNFPMMFVRTDILGDLEIDIPKTWEDIYVAQSKLESNNMEIGVTTDYKIFLYQLGGELFADGGMRINLDSEVGLQAFDTMCNMFTQYSFPYKYDAANRFRTGEMPIIISSYTGLYNHLKVFATELDSCWTFVPLPGYEIDGEINNASVSSVTAAVMIKMDDKDYTDGWEFVKWYTDAPCQAEYANEMVAIIGDSAKHSTANRHALESMPWTYDEYTEVSKQFENLASIPNYPGYYIIDRYTEFAFLSAYNDDADPRTELLSYINIINKEITRKREEFKLETLEIGQKLSDKRAAQALTAMNELASQFISEGNTKYDAAITTAKYAIANNRVAQLYEASEMFAQILAADWDGAMISYTKVDGTEIQVPSYYKNIGKQTSENRDGGYKISSLNEQQMIFFISECLADIADALTEYNR